jgi:magnesium transporter
MTPNTPLRATLFDAGHRDPQQIDVRSIDVDTLADTQLLWIELQDAADLDGIDERLGIPAEVMAALREPEATPGILDAGDCFWLRACGIRSRDEDENFDLHAIDLVAGRNFVVSFRNGAQDEPVPILDKTPLRRDIGRLNAASFVAARLHALLSTYFEEVSRIEIRVERIDQAILEPGRTHCMDELRSLLRSTSRLRRALAGHRELFTGLARPDFRPADGEEPRRHFAALDEKYERAMDVVENSRDLVIGSFELFSSRTALSTNETMRTLTFLTVLIGTLAVAAGIFGMNFEAGFFESEAGFWIALGGMALAGAVVMLVARWRRWM